MRSTTLFLLFLLLSFPPTLAAQGPINIFAISPSGPIAEGTVITVFGENFIAAIQCILPCPTTVTLDGVTLELLELSPSRIVFKAPTHAPGLVEFVIRRADGVMARLPLRYGDGVSSHWETVLLPFWIEQTPGAFGSQWTTRLTMHNSGSNPVSVGHLVCAEICPPVFPLTFSIPPGETAIDPLIARNRAGLPPGRLIYLSRSGAEGIRSSLKLRDHSRDALLSGVEIPVVREEDFLVATAHLIDVPVDPRFRQSLRIYDVDPSLHEEYAIRIYPVRSDPQAPPLVEVHVAIESKAEEDLSSDPGYFQILDLSETYPQLRAASRLRIEVDPLTPGARFWAVVSVTNKTTQQVTVIPPQ